MSSKQLLILAQGLSGAVLQGHPAQPRPCGVNAEAPALEGPRFILAEALPGPAPGRGWPAAPGLGSRPAPTKPLPPARGPGASSPAACRVRRESPEALLRWRPERYPSVGTSRRGGPRSSNSPRTPPGLPEGSGGLLPAPASSAAGQTRWQLPGWRGLPARGPASNPRAPGPLRLLRPAPPRSRSAAPESPRQPPWAAWPPPAQRPVPQQFAPPPPPRTAEVPPPWEVIGSLSSLRASAAAW